MTSIRCRWWWHPTMQNSLFRHWLPHPFFYRIIFPRLYRREWPEHTSFTGDRVTVCFEVGLGVVFNFAVICHVFPPILVVADLYLSDRVPVPAHDIRKVWASCGVRMVCSRWRIPLHNEVEVIPKLLEYMKCALDHGLNHTHDSTILAIG